MRLIFAALSIFIFSSYALSREVTFEWEPFENVKSYELHVSQDKNFKHIILKKDSIEPKITENLKMGHYFYRVRAIAEAPDKKLKPGHWSEPIELDILPYAPELTEPKDGAEWSYYEKKVVINFSWKELQEKPDYEILITKANGQKVLEKKLSEEKISLSTLDGGTYLWKVRSVYDKKYFSDYSETRKFIIEQKPIQTPQLVHPIQNILKPAYRSIELNWDQDAITKATDVEMEYIARNKASQKAEDLPKINNLSSNYYVMPFAEEGEYHWRVITKEDETTPGVSSLWETFHVSNDLMTDDNYSVDFGMSYISQTDQYVSSRTGVSHQFSSPTTPMIWNFSGKYFFTLPYALQLDMQMGDQLIDGFSVPRSRITISNRLRFGASGFQQELFLGYRQMYIYEVVEQPVKNYNLLTANGPVIGTSMQGIIFPQWKIGINLLYFKPTGHVEQLGNLSGDFFEGALRASYNPFYQVWVNLEFRYEQALYTFYPNANPQTLNTQWSSQAITPIFLGISYEH